MNLLTRIGGCWINSTRGIPSGDIGNVMDEPPDTGSCDTEDAGGDADEPGECDPDDDGGSCWDPPDVGW